MKEQYHRSIIGDESREVDELREQSLEEGVALPPVQVEYNPSAGTEKATIFSPENKERLPEIHRDIVSAVIISADRKFLMGLKDPEKGGVYPDAWHLIGGGAEEGESQGQALQREGLQEAGIDLMAHKPKWLPFEGYGESEKMVDGKKVWCKVDFNRAEVYIDQDAHLIKVKPGGDIKELRWFTAEEMAEIKQIPGGKEFLIEASYIDEEK